jgi:hypothetical protein
VSAGRRNGAVLERREEELWRTSALALTSSTTPPLSPG